MVDIERRKFLKNVGLCTILLTTGNIEEGITYIAPVFGGNSLIQPATEVNRICFVGVGESGLQTARPLARGLYGFPDAPSCNDRKAPFKNSIGIVQFDPFNQGIYAFLQHKDLVFLVGSLMDRDFWIARDVILSTDTRLLINIFPSGFDSSAAGTMLSPGPNESFLCIGKEVFMPSAIYVVRDICSLILLPNLICISFIDIVETLAGSSANAFCVECSMEASIEKFRNLTVSNKHCLNHADSFCMIISYDSRASSTMEHVWQLGEQMLIHIKQSAEKPLYAVNISQELDTDLRATILAAKKHGLI